MEELIIDVYDVEDMGDLYINIEKKFPIFWCSEFYKEEFNVTTIKIEPLILRKIFNLKQL